jgi:hypothetical protein
MTVLFLFLLYCVLPEKYQEKMFGVFALFVNLMCAIAYPYYYFPILILGVLFVHFVVTRKR